MIDITHSTDTETRFGSDSRGVSIPLEYAMGFMILLIVSGVFTMGIATIKDQQSDMAIQQELERINYKVSHAIDTVDALARQSYHQSGTDHSVTIRVHTPEHVAKQSYYITINSSGYLIVETNNGDIRTATPLDIDHATNVPFQTVPDGTIIITYNATTNTINLHKP